MSTIDASASNNSPGSTGRARSWTEFTVDRRNPGCSSVHQTGSDPARS
jgi:hypothetical protein